MGLEFSMKTCHRVFHGPWNHGERNDFMGHWFVMNPIKVYFMGHEKVVMVVPVAMNVAGIVPISLMGY